LLGRRIRDELHVDVRGAVVPAIPELRLHRALRLLGIPEHDIRARAGAARRRPTAGIVSDLQFGDDLPCLEASGTHCNALLSDDAHRERAAEIRVARAVAQVLELDAGPTLAAANFLERAQERRENRQAGRAQPGESRARAPGPVDLIAAGMA